MFCLMSKLVFHFLMESQRQRIPSHVVSYDGFELYTGHCHYAKNEIKPWIHQFCSKPCNNWFVAVVHDYATDIFNYYGFKKYIPNFSLAMSMICDRHGKEFEYLSDEEIMRIHDQAKQLYGLIHSRWICTTPGLSMMKKKAFKKVRFGRCPRTACKGTPLIPIGITNVPNRHSVKLFCTRCADIYSAPCNKKIDGAFYGPAFPTVFLLAYPDLDLRDHFHTFDFKLFGFNLKSKKFENSPHNTNNHTEEYILMKKE